MQQPTAPAGQQRALWASTFAFTICFAVWTIFSIIGISIKQRLGLTDTQFGLLVGTSSGANISAALRTAAQMPPGSRVVTILCDRAERYYSTKLFAPALVPEQNPDNVVRSNALPSCIF